MDKIKKRSVSPRIVSVSATASQILGPNNRRVGIVFGSTSQGSVSYSFRNDVAINKGTYNIPASTAYIESLCCCEYGISLQQPFYAIASGSFDIEVTEIISDEPLE